MPTQKSVLIVTDQVDRNDSSSDCRYLRNLFAQLQANGISYGRAIADNMPSDAAINEYDVIIFPELIIDHNASWTAVIDNAGTTIPMIALQTRASAGSGMGASPGVSGSATGQADQFVTCSFTDNPWFALSTYSYTLTDGTPLLTIADTSPIAAEGAQANAGEVCAWSSDTVGGSRIFFSSVHAQIHQMLPFMLAMAINEGVLAKNVIIKKIPFCIDLDHPNGSSAQADPTILDTIVNLLPAGGMMSCGLSDEDFASTKLFVANMPAALKTKLIDYQAAGKFKYSYHNHDTSFGDIMDGTAYPNAGSNKTKAQQETQYDAVAAEFVSIGLTFDVNPGHMNPGKNMFDENSLQLYTQNVTVLADGAETTTQAGYGYTTIRTINQASRYMGSFANIYTCQHHFKHTIHGITIFRGHNIGDDLGGGVPTTTAEWQDIGRGITHALSFGTIPYFHDQDFVTADQDPGVDKHGVVLMGLLADIGTYLNDVCVPFADITQFVNPKKLDLS